MQTAVRFCYIQSSFQSMYVKQGHCLANNRRPDPNRLRVCSVPTSPWLLPWCCLVLPASSPRRPVRLISPVLRCFAPSKHFETSPHPRRRSGKALWESFANAGRRLLYCPDPKHRTVLGIPRTIGLGQGVSRSQPPVSTAHLALRPLT
jgi:hypothetical protein